MTTKEVFKMVEQAGTKVSKDKVVDALRRMPNKDVAFAKDVVTGYSIILVKLG